MSSFAKIGTACDRDELRRASDPIMVGSLASVFAVAFRNFFGMKASHDRAGFGAFPLCRMPDGKDSWVIIPIAALRTGDETRTHEAVRNVLTELSR